MKHRTLALLILSLAAGCGSQQPSASPSTTVPSPTAVDAGVAACTADQLGLATGQMEGAAGTSYITVRVSLVSGPPCTILDWPAVDIDDATADAIATAEGDVSQTGETVTVSSYVDFNLGWASWCAAPPARPLTAQIGLLEGGAPVSVVLPDDYAPSGCLGSSTVVSIQPAS
jgi:hypothetical protein